MKKSKHVFVPADKSRNYYKLSPQETEKRTIDNITKDYRLTEKTAVNTVDLKAKEIATLKSSTMARARAESQANAKAKVTS